VPYGIDGPKCCDPTKDCVKGVCEVGQARMGRFGYNPVLDEYEDPRTMLVKLAMQLANGVQGIIGLLGGAPANG